MVAGTDWREPGRRAQAAADLRLIATVAGYASRQMGNGLTPEQARQAALEMAGELEATATSLRKLALRPADRRALAAELDRSGLGTSEIARQLGLSVRTIRYYLAGRPD
jgi:DNA-binding NarL/FixJ family response regulator